MYSAHEVIKVGDQLRLNAANEQRVHDDQNIKDIEKVRQFYSSPTKQSDNRWTFYNPDSDDSNSEDEDYIQDEDDSSTDDDASHEVHDESSDYDEEASDFRKKARKQTRNPSGIVQNQ